MQLQAHVMPPDIEYILVRLTLIGIGLSIIGGLLSVFLVCYVPLRSDGLFSICNMCVALVGAQLAFAGAENAFPTKLLCKISTASLHFLFSAVHFWSLSFSVHLIMKLLRVLQNQRFRKRLILVSLGWLGPVVVVAVTAVVSGADFGNHRACWLTGSESQWAFIGPVCAISGVNVVVLGVVVAVQYKHDSRKEMSGVRKMKNLAMTILTQLPVTNVTWLLGLVPPTYVAFQCLFVMVNASQGMVIFACHMMCSSQIRAMFEKRHQGTIETGDNREQDVSKTGSTGHTQSVDTNVIEEEELKTISFSKQL